MGNDGGSIPTRRELVKEAARNPTTSELKQTLQEQQDHLWNIDPLSQKPLSTPVVSDSLGRLFNKESVLEFLLSVEGVDEARKAEQEAVVQGRFKSLRDVVEVRFQVGEGSDKSSTQRPERWICPVTSKELGPRTKSVYIVPCGHAFSEAAIEQVSSEEQNCLLCNEPFASNDVIPILPTSETDIAQLTLRVSTLQEKGLTHALKKLSGGKKEKKRKKEAPEDGHKENGNGVDATETATDANNSRSQTSTPQPNAAGYKAPSSSINNAATASLTAKVMQDQRNKRRKIRENDNLNSLFSKPAKEGERKSRDIDFMRRGFAMPGNR